LLSLATTATRKNTPQTTDNAAIVHNMSQLPANQSFAKCFATKARLQHRRQRSCVSGCIHGVGSYEDSKKKGERTGREWDRERMRETPNLPCRRGSTRVQRDPWYTPRDSRWRDRPSIWSLHGIGPDTTRYKERLGPFPKRTTRLRGVHRFARDATVAP
jgi:hypothetical protein